jgi:hypothetical protein
LPWLTKLQLLLMTMWSLLTWKLLTRRNLTRAIATVLPPTILAHLGTRDHLANLGLQATQEPREKREFRARLATLESPGEEVERASLEPTGTLAKMAHWDIKARGVLVALLELVATVALRDLMGLQLNSRLSSAPVPVARTTFARSSVSKATS